MFKILEKKILNAQVTQYTIYAPRVAAKALPGQFIIFRIDETGERIPITISDYSREKGTVTIVVQQIGKSTMKLSTLNEGDFIADFVGPLGRPSELDGYKKVAVVGGGLGCAIAYPQAKYLNSVGTEVDIIAGFRNKDLVILEDEMKNACSRLILCTDDGSYGKAGFVTNALEDEILAGENYDLVVAIGPAPMMKFVCAVTKKYNIKTIVSMNTIMIDGTGMCGGCRLTVGGQTKFACVDGPDFDGHLVDFDEVIRRSGQYKEYEGEACNLFAKEREMKN